MNTTKKSHKATTFTSTEGELIAKELNNKTGGFGWSYEDSSRTVAHYNENDVITKFVKYGL